MCRIWTLLEDLIAEEKVVGVSSSSSVFDADRPTPSICTESDTTALRPRTLSHDISVSNLLVYPSTVPRVQQSYDDKNGEESGGQQAVVTALSSRIRDLEKENTILRKRLLNSGL